MQGVITNKAKFLDYVDNHGHPLRRGDYVSKTSNKPFQSGIKINTIIGFTIHEQTGNAGAVFVEDDSVVECWRLVKLVG